MEPVKLRLLSARSHCDQIVTGFLMLQERLGKDRFLLEFERVSGHPDAAIPLAEARIGNASVFYDLEDCYWTYPRMRELLDGCTAYFKRSFSEEENRKRFSPEQSAKLLPLGLNYPVQYRRLLPDAELLYGRRIRPWRSLVPADVEAVPSRWEPKLQRVCFYTRLWDPEEVGEPYREHFRQVSESRIRLIRLLRERFPRNFSGGLEDSAYARRTAPDLVLPRWATPRRIYLSRMKRADIVVTSTGLHGSTGWKFGEYVAASRAIVSEPLEYRLPGKFAEGTHYLAYRTEEECADRVQCLLEEPQRRYSLQEACRQYYLEYLRPDRLIENSLRSAGLL